MSRSGTRYGRALRLTLRATAAAYGYTLTISTTVAMLSAVHSAPSTGELFLFLAGGVAAFAALEGVLHLLGSGEEGAEHGFPFAGALNLVSAAAALGAATGVAHATSHTLAWLLLPMAATGAYMAAVALQLTVVEMERD